MRCGSTQLKAAPNNKDIAQSTLQSSPEKCPTLNPMYNSAWAMKSLSLVRVPSNPVGSGTFGWLATAPRAETEEVGVPTVLGGDMVAILYFKARCSKYNVLVLNSDSS